jgi:hypothetical protein
MFQWLRSVGHGRPAASGESVLVANYLYLRKAVGWLGTLLPVILLAANPIALKIVHSSCGWLPGSVRPPFPWLFLYEAVGIFAFGVSWFVEGQTLIGPLKDPPSPVAEALAQH